MVQGNIKCQTSRRRNAVPNDDSEQGYYRIL